MTKPILIYYRRFLCFLFPRDILKCPWHFIFEICHGHFIGVTGTLLKIETGKKKCHEQTVKKVTGSCYGHFCIFEINHGNTKNCHGYNKKNAMVSATGSADPWRYPLRESPHMLPPKMSKSRIMFRFPPEDAPFLFKIYTSLASFPLNLVRGLNFWSLIFWYQNDTELSMRTAWTSVICKKKSFMSGFFS